MSERTRKYEVTVKEKVGSCDNTLFEKMAKKGDITSIKLSDVVGMVVKIIGYAKCTIETDEKTFDINYFDTEEYGLISSGSEIFAESVSGITPPWAERLFQKKEWFQCCPALLKSPTRSGLLWLALIISSKDLP